MDYPNQTRLKILANAEVVDARKIPDILEYLVVPGYKAKIERAMILHVEAFHWNCPQHITQRFTMDEVKTMIAPMNEHIEKLEQEIEELKMQKPAR